MLVLRHHTGQTIRIDESIQITVLDIWRDKALLAAEAPAGAEIIKEELLSATPPTHKPRQHTMRVLARREGEALKIGDHIRITAMKVKGNQVFIGIEAPRWVKVWQDRR